ncbi:MAG: hypothetical protein QW734_05310 [Candidatus Bathyarchaeia archaeon]
MVETIGEARLVVEDGKIFVFTPFDELFIGEIKQHFPQAKFDRDRNAWAIPYTQQDYEYLRSLLESIFVPISDVLVVACREDKPPSVDKMFLYEFTRDTERPRKLWNANAIAHIRVSHGSRKYPLFSGIFLFRVRKARNTVIRADEMREYPFSHELQDKILEIFKEHGKGANKENYKEKFAKIIEEIDKYLKEKEAEKEKEKLGIEEIRITPVSAPPVETIRGFLIVSSLPSKALLEERLPKFLEDIEVGREVIKLTSGYFYNKLGSLSRKFYVYILPKYTISTPFGYVLPTSQVEAFTKKIEELKEEYRKFEKDLENFLRYGKIPEDLDKRAVIDQRYLEIVRDYLKQHEREIVVPDIANRVKITLVPFEFSASFALELLKKSPEYAKLVEEAKKDIRESIVSKLNSDVENLMKKIQLYKQRKITEKALTSLRDDIQRVVGTARDFGITLEKEDVLSNLLNEIDSALQGKVELKDMGRLEALLKEMTGEKPTSTAEKPTLRVTIFPKETGRVFWVTGDTNLFEGELKKRGGRKTAYGVWEFENEPDLSGIDAQIIKEY